ncbi:MAG TPA: peptidoglycan DD-metalloendopeptidase family protein [Rhizomicrobium sp.]|nr:peptidoglycan DD-metalloendopeptidase family protein [Rhizomicrobium sp.]
MDPRHATAPFANFLSQWRNSTRNAASVLSSTDGRWALVSTSVTALVAGSIAWLAAGTIPMDGVGRPSRDRSLMPYELFLRLAKQTGGSASYASFAPLGSSQQVSPLTHSGASPLDYSLATERSGATEDSGIETRTITMDPGDTLVGALTDAGVSDDDANAAVVALARSFDVRSLRAGQSFDLTFQATPHELVTPPAPPQNTHVAQITYAPPPGAEDADSDFSDAVVDTAPTPAGKLLSVTFSPSVEHEVTIARGANGAFTAQDQVKELKERVHRAGATIDSSLYLAAMQAGIPADVVVQMIKMFSYEVDFQRDLKPGNSFEVLYSYYYTPDGQAAKQGDIKYAAMKIGGRTIALYRFDPKGPDGPDYFDANGQSAKGMLMKTPVDGARITSGFGMRFHPVLGYSRMHKGIDFGVPVGTPVMAAGSGTVVTEGWGNGYGNFLKINHGNGYSTGYGHLSRFAPGIHKGSHVRQGQIVAYSGNTGLTTGPHLHYEIFIGANQVNPTTVKIAKGIRLSGKELVAFKNERQHLLTEMAAMPLESKVADTGGDLRAAKD